MENYIKSEFVSPTYQIHKIPIDDIVAQKSNPNSMNVKSFAALQQSIFNTGYAGPVTVAPNKAYDESTKDKERPSLIEHTDSDDDVVRNHEGGMQVADEDIGKYFPYRLIDGAHRSQVIRLGKWYFENGYNKSEEWSKGDSIPEKPGPNMLAYLAWREDFCMPCCILDIDETSQMSAEILMNTARGSHGLEGMKDIVNNLINVAGMSKEWVAQNLYLDIESIDRMQQLSGLKASMNDIDDCDLAWNAKNDDSYKRKEQAYINRESAKYIETYKREHPDAIIPDVGTSEEIATQLGWSKEEALQGRKQAVELSINGAREHSPKLGYPKEGYGPM